MRDLPFAALLVEAQGPAEPEVGLLSVVGVLDLRTYKLKLIPVRQNRRIASYALNPDAVAHAKQLIDAHQYVLRSRWQDAQPRAREQNAFLKTHSFADYALWHLGLTEGADDETKARYAFVYGDLRRLHRMGLIACHYRAAEWRHKEIELGAHELLQYLDAKSARKR